jgi:SAM-dependent methyltransferase
MILPRPSLLPTLVRELARRDHVARQPEPDVIMNDPAHVAAYAESGRADGIMAAANLFHSARASLLVQDCNSVLDLGCGPGTQLVQIAELNPGVRFVGVDLADNMLADARRYSAARRVRNVQWQRADICALAQFADGSFDAVISTMTLHHLPSREHLDRCFAEIGRVLRPRGALYLADFGHLKTSRSIRYFAHMHRDSLPREVCEDYERSLQAAFRVEDYRAASARLAFPTQVYATFLVPLMIIVETPDRMVLPGTLQTRLRDMRQRLHPRYRRELDELRLFFRLSGLPADAFR